MTKRDDGGSCTSLLSAVEKFSGFLDKDGVRNCEGCQQWRGKTRQTYRGQFLYDNLHGEGTYTIESGDAKTIHNGLFYTNTLEGYGQVVYNDNHYFEGLFKKNRRFGPGVCTHPNGTQDVGLWDGTSLRRLSCVVNTDWMPRIAKSPAAKARILKYRTLVPVCRRTSNKAIDILKKMGATDELCEEESSKMYNVYIRNPESVFFNKLLYNENFFSEEDCVIEVAVNPEEISPKTEEEDDTKTPSAKSLVALDYCACSLYKRARVNEMRDEIYLIDSNLMDLQDTIENLKIFIKALENQSDEECEETNKNHINYLHICEDSWSKVSCTEAAQNRLTKALKEENLLRARKSAVMKIFQVWHCSPMKTPEITEEESSTGMEIHLKGTVERNHQSSLIWEGFVQDPVLPTKKVVVSDLLSWNNEKISTEMLKHCFLHRYSEQKVTFNVSKLLTGERRLFRKPGVYEESCIRFLNCCSSGKTKTITDLFRKHELNPDLCDARSNTGIFFATARDKTEAIKILVNIGAGLDIFNDECFTPLTLCITRYLSVLYSVTDWDYAFLPDLKLNDEDQKQIKEWNVFKSASNVSIPSFPSVEIVESMKFYKSTDTLMPGKKTPCPSYLFDSEYKLELVQYYIDQQKDDIQSVQEPYMNTTDEKQPFILSTACVKPSPPKKVVKKGSSKRIKKPEVDKSKLGGSAVSFEMQNAKMYKLEKIFETLCALLRCGADPNLGEVPLPPLILSLFTKNADVVEELLKWKANPDIRDVDDNNAPLHYIASLPGCRENVEICKVLLDYEADPNCRNSPKHWAEEKPITIGKVKNDVLDEGKGPLHLLCMRYDFELDPDNFLHDIANLMIDYGAKTTNFYLGHTPLTLAVIRGNAKLIQTLLESGRVDPNQKLKEGMGVPLTVLILKRYPNILPLGNAVMTYDALIEGGANPFNEVDSSGNTIEFMSKEHDGDRNEDKGKGLKKKKSKSSKSTKSSKSSKSSNKSKKGKKGKDFQKPIREYLFSRAFAYLCRRIKLLVTKYLYDFTYEGLIGNSFTEALAKFLSPNELIGNIQILIHSGRIKRPYYSRECFWDLLDYVRVVTAKPPPRRGRAQHQHLETTDHDIAHLFTLGEALVWRKLPKGTKKYYRHEPGLDKDQKKYIVCFHCLKKKGKDLIVCPICQMVYFCSQQCNILNNKLDTPHKCRVLFYDSQKALRDECLRNGGVWDPFSTLKGMLGLVDKIREERRAQMELAKKLGKEYQMGGYKKGLFGRDGALSPSALLRKRLGKGDKASQTGFTRDKGTRVDFDEKQRGRKSKRGKGDGEGGSRKGGTGGTSTSRSRSRSRGRSASRDRGRDKGDKGGVSSLDRARQRYGRTRLDLSRLLDGKLPDKNRCLIENIGKLFPGFDLTKLLLPYACYADGELYYKFNTLLFVDTKTYSTL